MDPLAHVNPGDPLNISAKTFNLLVDAARETKKGFRVGAGPNERLPLVPSTEVWIKNTTGGTLAEWSVVTPTGYVLDPDTDPIPARRNPVFEVSAPTTVDDLVFLTVEPIADGRIGRAVATGIAVAVVDVSDAAHRFAVPIVGNLFQMDSATCGPARLAVPAGTGTAKRLVVLGAPPCAEGFLTVEDDDSSPTYPGITTLQFDQDDGFSISNPSAGVAKIDFTGGGTSSQWKEPVRVATTTNGTLASAFENGDTVDGVVLATGNRILLKNQTTATENGIYTVNASGAPTRAADAAAGSSAVNAVVAVSEGTENADTIWMNNTSNNFGATLVFVCIYPNLYLSSAFGASGLNNTLTSYTSVTLPAGRWWLEFNFTYLLGTSAGALGTALLRYNLYDATAAAYILGVDRDVWIQQGTQFQGTAFDRVPVTLSVESTIELHARKLSTETYVASSIGPGYLTGRRY